MNRKDLERPKEADFAMTGFEGRLVDFKAYAEALEEYCDDLEYDLEYTESDNNELTQKLEEIEDIIEKFRDVIDGYY